jgi:hypothetical protein
MSLPTVKPRDWIKVGDWDCVMKIVKEQENDCYYEVVFNPSKPTTHEVKWVDGEWVFADTPDYGGYGRDSDPFVVQLKRGLS